MEFSLHSLYHEYTHHPYKCLRTCRGLDGSPWNCRAASHTFVPSKIGFACHFVHGPDQCGARACPRVHVPEERREEERKKESHTCALVCSTLHIPHTHAHMHTCTPHTPHIQKYIHIALRRGGLFPLLPSSHPRTAATRPRAALVPPEPLLVGGGVGALGVGHHVEGRDAVLVPRFL